MTWQGCSPAKHILFLLTLAAQLAVSTDTDCSAHPASEVPCPSKHVGSLTLLAAIGIPVLIVVIAIGGYAFHVFRRSSGGRSDNKVYNTVPPTSTALLQTTSTKSMASLEEGLSPTVMSYSDTSSDFGTRTRDSDASPQVRELSTPETARTMYGYGVGVI